MSVVRRRAIGGVIAAVLLMVAVVAGMASGPAQGSVFEDGRMSIAGATTEPGDVAVLSPVVLQVDSGPRVVVCVARSVQEECDAGLPARTAG